MKDESTSPQLTNCPAEMKGILLGRGSRTSLEESDCLRPLHKALQRPARGRVLPPGKPSSHRNPALGTLQ